MSIPSRWSSPFTGRPGLLGRALPALLLISGVAAAQGYGFAPTALNIDPLQTLTTETTMINTSRSPARFTVEPRAWKMVDGAAVLSDTRDLIVNPSSFTIPGGGSQVIRVGLRKRPGSEELTYRLLVQQQPLPGSMPVVNQAVGDGRTAQVNLAIAFSLPVYIAAPSARAKVAYTVRRDGDDLIFGVSNSGTRHATYNNLTAQRGGKLVNTQAFSVLAGANLDTRLPGLGAVSGPLALTYRNADGEMVSETVSVP